MLKQMKQIRNIIMVWLLFVVPMASFAQLKKTATIVKLKSFTNGSVTLTKTMTEKGEHFDFEVMGQTYSLAYSTTLGQKCFKVWEPNGISSDFGRLYKATIDDMIKYFMEQ